MDRMISITGSRIHTPASSNSPDHQHDDQNDENQSDRSRRIMAPSPAIPPRWNRSDQKKEQENEENNHQSQTSLCSTLQNSDAIVRILDVHVLTLDHVLNVKRQIRL